MMEDDDKRTPQPIRDVTILIEGQHIQMPISIKIAAIAGYHHHAIVEEVTVTEEGEILVNVIGRGEFGITREIFTQKERPVELVNHSKPKFNYSETYQRALKKLKELGRKDQYHAVENNCEHFVEWCVNGVARCLQIENSNFVMRKIITTAGNKLFWSAKAAAHRGEAQ